MPSESSTPTRDWRRKTYIGPTLAKSPGEKSIYWKTTPVRRRHLLFLPETHFTLFPTIPPASTHDTSLPINVWECLKIRLARCLVLSANGCRRTQYWRYFFPLSNRFLKFHKCFSVFCWNFCLNIYFFPVIISIGFVLCSAHTFPSFS